MESCKWFGSLLVACGRASLHSWLDCSLSPHTVLEHMNAAGRTPLMEAAAMAFAGGVLELIKTGSRCGQRLSIDSWTSVTEPQRDCEEPRGQYAVASHGCRVRRGVVHAVHAQFLTSCRSAGTSPTTGAGMPASRASQALRTAVSLCWLRGGGGLLTTGRSHSERLPRCGQRSASGASGRHFHQGRGAVLPNAALVGVLAEPSLGNRTGTRQHTSL